jgi:membrane-bound serine protease (ClpP class)
MLFETNAAAFRLSIGIIAGFAIVSVLLLVGMIAVLLRSRQRPAASGADRLIGSAGEAVNDFDGRGQVRIGGELWSASSDVPLARGQQVRVLARDGLQLRVEPISVPERSDNGNSAHE